jgi:hypothetical protein
MNLPDEQTTQWPCVTCSLRGIRRVATFAPTPESGPLACKLCSTVPPGDTRVIDLLHIKQRRLSHGTFRLER